MSVLAVGPTGRNFRMRVSGLEGEAASNGVAFVPRLQAAYVVGGKDDFKDVKLDAVQPANSAWRLYYGHMKVGRGFVRAQVNPEILDTAMVSYQSFWEERTEGSLFVIVRAFKNTVYPQDWVVKLYIED